MSRLEKQIAILLQIQAATKQADLERLEELISEFDLMPPQQLNKLMSALANGNEAKVAELIKKAVADYGNPTASEGDKVTFANGVDSLEIDGNIVTITNGNQHISAIAPIWLTQVIEQDKVALSDITFTDIATKFVFAAIGKLSRRQPPPEQFEPIKVCLPRQMTLTLHDTGLIELSDGKGKQLGFKHKTTIAQQLARFIQVRKV